MQKIQFDSRDKKPNLYWLLIPILITAAAVCVLLFLDAQRCAVYVCAASAALSLIVAGALVHALTGQLRYNPYSYNTIYYTGFSLFMLFVFSAHIVVSIRLYRRPDVYTVNEILRLLLGSAKSYMFFSSLFLFVFSGALCVSNVSLIRHEGKRLVNLLGILLSVLIVAGVMFVFCFDYAVSGSKTYVMIHDLITNLIAAIYLYFECMLIGTIAANIIAVRHEPEPDRDFIIILGCGLRKDGSPTPLLRGRIDRALSFAKAQTEKTGKAPVFITSGGQGADEVISESAAMKRYLMQNGVPESQIIEENRSASTEENMRFSKEIITAIRPNAKIAFATTNYHVFRSGLFARRVKMRAIGMGAKTKWYFWPNAAVREFVGLLTKHKIKQGLVLGSMVVTYIVMTLLAYR